MHGTEQRPVPPANTEGRKRRLETTAEAVGKLAELSGVAPEHIEVMRKLDRGKDTGPSHNHPEDKENWDRELVGAMVDALADQQRRIEELEGKLAGS